MGAKGRYTAEIKKEIFECLRTGMTDKQTCAKVHINPDTFYTWLAKKNDFSELVKTAKEDFRSGMVKKLEDSLYRKAIGYDAEETETEYTFTKDGNPVAKKKTRKNKHIQPDTGAIIFALTNLAPEEWKNKQFQQIDGNVKTESDTQVSLANVPDELLAEVISKINGK